MKPRNESNDNVTLDLSLKKNNKNKQKTHDK